MAPKKTDASKVKTENEPLPEAEDDVEPGTPTVEAAPEEEPEPPAAAPQPVGDEGRDAIVQLYRERRRQENAAADSPAPEPEQVSNSDEGEPEPEADTQPVEVELVIDGQTVKKPLAEVIALAQMNSAADKRLEEAKRILSEAQAQAKLLAERGPEHPRGAQTASEPTEARDDEPPEHPPAEDIDPAKLREIAERIQVGDADEGVQALNELVALVNKDKPKSQEVSAEQVGAIVQQHLLQRETQREIDAALEQFGKDFPELAKDTDLRTLGLDLVAREMRNDLKQIGLTDADLAPFGNDARALAQAHRTARMSGHKVRSYGDVLSSVGGYMTKKFNLKGDPPSQQQQRPDAQIAANREERKRATPQQPRTAGARVPTQQTPRPKTADQVVQEMRVARGFAKTA